VHTTSSGTPGPIDEVVDEVEELVLGPVQIFEHEHGRPLLGKRLEEPAPGDEALAALVASRFRFRAEPDERAEVLCDPLSAVRHEAGDAFGQLVLGLLGRVRLENPCCAFTISASAQ
jgi:hypothetical protein